MARDNFSSTVINQLRDRVAHRCSNPECRVPTSAPSHTGHGVNNIGIAAHITAASPNGPRYDSSMTQDNRKSFGNGIWLCSNCSIKIDRDHEKYSVALLKNWKCTAESKALLEVGRKIPSDDDAISTLTSALTGVHNNKLTFSAISNVHKAVQRTFELLDNRFAVKTAYTNEKLSFSLSAKVPVLLSIKPIRNSANYHKLIKETIENAVPIKILSQEITIEGSNLIEHLHEHFEYLTITPIPIKATARLFTRKNKLSRAEYIETFHGNITSGTKLILFNLTGFNKVISITQKITIDHKTLLSGRLSIELHHWNGMDIRYISDFEKVYEVIKSIADGQLIEIYLEIGKSPAGKLENIAIDKSIFVELENYLHFIKCCRNIAFFFDLCLYYTDELHFSENDHQDAYELSSLLVQKKYFAKDLNSNILGEITITEENAHIIKMAQNKGVFEFKIAETLTSQHTLMGVKIPPFTKITTIHNSTININKKMLKPGNCALVEFIPQDGFFCEIRCDYNNLIG